MIKRVLILITVLTLAVLLSSCSQDNAELQDGYYSAEAAEFDTHGWKEYITIYVRANKIVTVEYNARNASGFIKSWDIDYMRNMQMTDGTYPNEYSRVYAVSLLNWQNPSGVDAVSGATHSHNSFKLLAEAAIAQARDGYKQVALVEMPEVYKSVN